MKNAIWDDQDKKWVIDVESTMRGDGAFCFSLSPEQAKALYYTLEEIWPEVDAQCADTGR